MVNNLKIATTFLDISNDTLINSLSSFLGALLSGILTGGIAIWIMRQGIKKGQKDEKKNDKKVKVVLDTVVSYAISCLLIFIPKLTSDNEDEILMLKLDRELLEKMKREIKKLKIARSQLATLPNSIIPNDLINEIEHIKILLTILEVELEEAINNKNLTYAEIEERIYLTGAADRLAKIMDHASSFTTFDFELLSKDLKKPRTAQIGHH